MQIIDLNLASRQFKNETLPWVLFAVAVGVIGFVSWWNISSFVQSRSATADLLDREQTIKHRMSDLSARQARAFSAIDRSDVESVLLRTDKANEVIRWKAFSWTRLFNVLQDVQPNNVQMVSINPVFHGNTKIERNDGIDPELVPIAVEGVCKNLRDFFEFQTNLLFDKRIHSVEPDRWSTDERSGETEFSLRFLYDPRVDDAAGVAAPPEATVAVGETPGQATETGAITTVATAGSADAAEVESQLGGLPPPAEVSGNLAAAPEPITRRKGAGQGRRAKKNGSADGGRATSPLPAGALDGPPKLVTPFAQPSEQGQELATADADEGDS